MSKKVFLTGGSGLIGKETLPFLLENDFEIYALCRENSSRNSSLAQNVNFVKVDLFDENDISRILSEIKPEYLLHFAWITGDDYLTNSLNNEYVNASMNLLEAFRKNAGKRAVFAGTCFEYAFKDEVLKENDKLDPQSLYAKCKVELCQKAMEYCDENNISFGWGRIFYTYGHNENPSRLTAYIINNLALNKPVSIKHSHLVRDYMYSKDIARAFVKFLLSNKNGAVNIGTGNGISLGKYARIIGEIMNKTHLLDLQSLDTNLPKSIIADTGILENEIGFKAQYSNEEMIKSALEEIIKSYIN